MWDNQLLIVAQPESHIDKEEINKKIEVESSNDCLD
jgi:hypothetical protein